MIKGHLNKYKKTQFQVYNDKNGHGTVLFPFINVKVCFDKEAYVYRNEPHLKKLFTMTWNTDRVPIF